MKPGEKVKFFVDDMEDVERIMEEFLEDLLFDSAYMEH
ncbi:hypothetical protein AN618_14540 [Fervidicola ferrireducens]|uniref:Uncharacterized protein n=1 Tax=Fervidicola ferrireducens TaxID=520764 RepID=A0A140L805_9FIRM|nr:hypothetical protein AN618_14540 [Fervidicola ferrireducens]